MGLCRFRLWALLLAVVVPVPLFTSGFSSPGSFLKLQSLGHKPSILRRAGSESAGQKPAKEQKPAKVDVYKTFLAKARSRGAEEALLYASSSMPKAFCLHFLDLKAAAEFAAGHVQHVQGRHGLEAPSRTTAPWQLQVCSKCLRKKSNRGFDTLGALRDLQLRHASLGSENQDLNEMTLLPTGCLKLCKYGPNVRAVSPGMESGTVITEMTPEEKRNQCFHFVNDTAAAERVFKAVRRASLIGRTGASGASDSPRSPGAGGAADPTIGAAVAAPAQQSAGSTNDKQKRNRVRESMETRVANILEGLPVRFSGEDLL
mmetsp:Transcript_68038/g.160155  ORF Transcript_68038/g.160155 Transcript_68038/m.160155 type:complete len:316 (-) Transcript_68038:6-953(-)